MNRKNIRRAFLLPIFAFAACGRKEPEPPQPRSVTSTTGRFRVELPPGFPEFTERRDGKTTFLSAEGKDGFCIISYFDDEPDVETLRGLPRSVDALTRRRRIERVDPHEYRGRPAVSARFTTSDTGSIMNWREDWIGWKSRVYSLAFASARPDAIDSVRVKAFFDSFDAFEPPEKEE